MSPTRKILTSTQDYFQGQVRLLGLASLQVRVKRRVGYETDDIGDAGRQLSRMRVNETAGDEDQEMASR